MNCTAEVNCMGGCTEEVKDTVKAKDVTEAFWWC
ncbi:hypothetical protein PF006_g25340 [Phytophthora fragariae]|uniref:Uncharacterized protein n=1 Tax=Phytophthora fragariae TaxID=53985 RepID=A0A6A3R6F8_9STRA|nr:hypothetical protein PF003_g28006 [Phytophthora fragariae]KAE9089538.1 hypothetical protein PF006_g25340 [Phytophthora fragariae]